MKRVEVCPLPKPVPALLQEISWNVSRNCSSDLDQVLDVSALLGDKVTAPLKDKRLFIVKCHSTLLELWAGNPRNFPATQGQGCCDISDTSARLYALPLPWRWTGPTLPDPNESLAEKGQHGAVAELGPTQTSASTQGWISWHQVHGKAEGRSVPSCWARGCSRGR